MSAQQLALVWERSKTVGTDRVVLLALADQAANDGTGHGPSLAELATLAGGISHRTIQRCIRHTENLGELELQRGATGRLLGYRLTIATEVHSQGQRDS